MSSENLIPLNITIGDRNYRIKILPSNEEVIRKTLKVINDQIVEYKTNFAGKDMQDYIAMVLIWYATQTGENTSVDTSEWEEALQKMESQIRDALQGD